MAKRKVKSEVSIRVKQGKKGTTKATPIVATVRIGQPKRRGTTVTDRMAKPILPQGRFFDGRPTDFGITAGFRNIENQQQNLFKALEEQRKSILDITQNTGQLMAERAGMRTLQRQGPPNSDVSTIADFPPSSSGDSTAPSKLLISVPSVMEERKVQKWVQAQREVIERDPRVVPSIISEPIDIEELAAGEDIDIPDVPQSSSSSSVSTVEIGYDEPYPDMIRGELLSNAQIAEVLGLTTQQVNSFRSRRGRNPSLNEAEKLRAGRRNR